jgi:hypothetical protein
MPLPPVRKLTRIKTDNVAIVAMSALIWKRLSSRAYPDARYPDFPTANQHLVGAPVGACLAQSRISPIPGSRFRHS